MMTAILLLAAASAAQTVTLSEARAMSPSALADRLLQNQNHGPVVDAIINGRGLTPPSQSVGRVWLIEQMVPFDATVCRSHVYNITMGTDDPASKSLLNAVPTHPVEVEQYDRLWAPPSGIATVATCAAAPTQASGFGDGGLGLQQAANLVRQARTSFKLTAVLRKIDVGCRDERGACGKNPRATLRAIDWSALGSLQEVTPQGSPYYNGDPKPKDAAWGPARVQFTFPYAAGGATWVITVDRAPAITAVRMEARTIFYE